MEQRTHRETSSDPAEKGGFLPPPLLRRSRSLLAHAARLLRVELTIWTEGSFPSEDTACRQHCPSCAQEGGSAPELCREILASRCQAVLREGNPVAWTCPLDARITAHPISGQDCVSAVLLCIDRKPSLRRRAEPRIRRAFLRDLARLLSDQLYLYKEMKSLAVELSTRNDELRMFYSVAGRLTCREDLRHSLRQMLEETRLTVEADAALLFLGQRRLMEVVVRPDWQAKSGMDRKHWDRVAGFLRRHLQESGQGFYTGPPWDPQGTPQAEPAPAQVMAVSVQHKGRPNGVLGLFHFDAAASFRSSDIKLLQSLAEQVALAVDNSELYEDLKDFLMATVKSLVGAIEAKDRYTSGHSERVNLVSMLLGRQIGLSAEQMETLRWASILHDVGKIGMPEGILTKPGKLTADEFRIIKEHPDRGYQLLSPIRQLRLAADVLRAHHEMIDGQGYPRGLRGEEIPLLARIIAVADTYDALTSTRAYRGARSLDFALAEIRRVRSTQLDERVVDHLLTMAPFLREHGIMIHAENDWAEAEAA